MVRKHKKILLIPLVWELTRALLLYFGYTLGTPWPLENKFFLRFAVPASWPTIDQILPVPVLSPDFTFLLQGRLKGMEGWFLGAVLLYALLDSLARGWFLIILKDVFSGKGVHFIVAFGRSWAYLNQFLILRLLMLVVMLGLAELAKTFSTIPPGLWDMLLACLGILLTFVDLVIIFGNITMPTALGKGIGLLASIGPPAIGLLVWGSIINATLSIPLNYTVAFFPAFMLAIAIFTIAGVILSVGLMYIFTTSLLTYQEK